MHTYPQQTHVSQGFATGLAIILTTAASVMLFDFKVTPGYLAGASTTLLAVLLYSGTIPRIADAIMGRHRSSGSGDSSNGSGALSEVGSSSGSDLKVAPLSPEPESAYPWSRVAIGGATARLLAVAGLVCPTYPRPC